MTGPISLFPGSAPPEGKTPTLKAGKTQPAEVGTVRPPAIVPTAPNSNQPPTGVDRTGPGKRLHPPVGHNTLSCTLYAIIAGLILLSIAVYFLSESGLLRVPFLSRYYQAPQPVRLIRAQSMDWENFKVRMSARLIEQQIHGAESFVLPVSEEELTGLFLTVAEQGLRSKNYKVDVAQVAVTTAGLEVFLKMDWRKICNMDLLVHLRPLVKSDGVVEFVVEDAQFGDLKIPGAWAMPLAGYLFTRDFGSWRFMMGDDINLHSISLFDRSLNIILGRDARTGS